MPPFTVEALKFPSRNFMIGRCTIARPIGFLHLPFRHLGVTVDPEGRRDLAAVRVALRQ